MIVSSLSADCEVEQTLGKTVGFTMLLQIRGLYFEFSSEKTLTEDAGGVSRSNNHEWLFLVEK